MKLINKLITTTALAVAAITATSANAATLLVSYAPVTDTNGSFSFNVDSNPTPISTSGTAFVAGITNSTGQYAGRTTQSFYLLANGGLFGNYFGPQVFTGTLAAPMFQTGTYAATFGNNAALAGIVTISDAAGAVPEPATWAMMILGMGAIGAAMRRRIKVSEVNFTNHVRAIANS